jgi:hypothetical protein
MAWNSSYSNQERRLCQGLLYPTSLPSPGTAGESPGWEVAVGRGHSGGRRVTCGQSYSKENKVLRADTHSLSLGALITFKASNARFTLRERKKYARTGFSP